MTTISSNTTITSASSYTWPITLGASVTITLGDDLSFSSADCYFIVGGNNVTIHGKAHVITIDGVTSYPGLVQNGTSAGSGYAGCSVDLVAVTTASSASLANHGGWIGQSYFTGSVTNCYSTGDVVDDNGGIVGSYSSSPIITACYTTGQLLGGGIVGSHTTNATITNCYTTGAIGAYAGGIGGYGSGGTITNCYTTGTVDSDGDGLAVASGYSITNSYSEGTGVWSDTNAAIYLIAAAWYSAAAGTNYLLAAFEGIIPCICRGMKILTPSGPVPVEHLKPGDMVCCPPLKAPVAIQNIHHETLVGKKDILPYRIPAGFFEPSVPNQDILLSPHHGYFYNQKWTLPIHTPGLEREASLLDQDFEYFHIQLPNYEKDKLWCHNLPIDSWDVTNTDTLI